MALTIMFVARSAGGLVSRFGVRAVLGSGLIMMTIGLLLFTRIAASGSPIVYVVVPGILTAAGIGFSIVPSTIAATQGAKQGQAGLASGLVNTSRQVGGGLGLALLITLATQYTTQQIGKGHGVPQALTDGFRIGYIIAAGFTAVALVVTLIAVPRMAVKGKPVRRVPAIIALGFVIAAFLGVEIATAGNHGAPIGAYVKDNTDVFVTQPNLHPPIVRTGNVATQPPGARLHLHDQLLRPHPAADDRPERAADPRQPCPAGVVPPGARGHGRRQPEPADLPRPAGHRVVAGQHHQCRPDAERRGRDRRQALPHDRHAEGQGRLDPHPARAGRSTATTPG